MVATYDDSSGAAALKELYRNISRTLSQMQQAQRRAMTDVRSARGQEGSGDGADGQLEEGVEEEEADDGHNAWLYILFVLMFYAFSIVVLLVKYIRREREGAKLEYYYNEFVKRDWYRDRNMYDARGRRVHYRVEEEGGVVVTKVEEAVDDGLIGFGKGRRRRRKRRRKSYYEDPDDIDCGNDDDEVTGGDEEEEESSNAASDQRGNSMMLILGAASILAESANMATKPIKHSNGSDNSSKATPPPAVAHHSEPNMLTAPAINLGARPKRSSMRNWPPKPAPAHRPSVDSSNNDGTSNESCEAVGVVGGRRDSVLEDYQTVPLAFYAPRNRLELARVDELSSPPALHGVRRAKSLPMRAHVVESIAHRVVRGGAGGRGRRSRQRTVRLSSSVRVMPSSSTYPYYGGSSSLESSTQDSPARALPDIPLD